MAAGKLEVEIVGRLDKLEKSLQAAEARVKKTGQTIDNTLNTPSGKLAVNMGKVFAFMGAAEGVVKGLGAGLHAAKGFSAMLKGDTEAMYESFEKASALILSLPFGIGAFAAAIDQVARSFTDIEEKLKFITDQQSSLARTRVFHDQATAMGIATAHMEKQRKILESNDPFLKAQVTYDMELEQLRAKFTHHADKLNVALKEARKHSGGEVHALQTQYKAMQDQFVAQKALIRVKKDAAELTALENKHAAERAQRDKEKETRAKRIADTQREAAKAEMAALKELNSQEVSRLGAVKTRLGLVMREAQTKSGFMNQGQTVFGSVQFAEKNVDEKIANLQKEAGDTQKRIETRTSTIEQLLVRISEKMGFA